MVKWHCLGSANASAFTPHRPFPLSRFARIPYAFRQVFKKRTGSQDEGDVSPFAALMTALSSTIGTGNIAGVAAAIAIGGPGAVFWMWMTAIVGTATKFSEGVLAVRYREVDANGNRVGGPMYYIKNGLGPNWKWLAVAFATLGMLAAWGTGASIQANSVADVLFHPYGQPLFSQLQRPPLYLAALNVSVSWLQGSSRLWPGFIF